MEARAALAVDSFPGVNSGMGKRTRDEESEAAVAAQQLEAAAEAGSDDSRKLKASDLALEVPAECSVTVTVYPCTSFVCMLYFMFMWIHVYVNWFRMPRELFFRPTSSPHRTY